jgi:hypothetical protein
MGRNIAGKRDGGGGKGGEKKAYERMAHDRITVERGTARYARSDEVPSAEGAIRASRFVYSPYQGPISSPAGSGYSFAQAPARVS